MLLALPSSAFGICKWDSPCRIFSSFLLGALAQEVSSRVWPPKMFSSHGSSSSVRAQAAAALRILLFEWAPKCLFMQILSLFDILVLLSKNIPHVQESPVPTDSCSGTHFIERIVLSDHWWSGSLLEAGAPYDGNHDRNQGNIRWLDHMFNGTNIWFIFEKGSKSRGRFDCSPSVCSCNNVLTKSAVVQD